MAIYSYVLLVYTCILAVSWIITGQTSKYLFLLELGFLLILILICDWNMKQNKKEIKVNYGVEK